MANIEKLIKEEFTLDPDLCYLNHAAVGPWPNRTARAVAQFAGENSRYGAVNYSSWLEMEKKLKNQLKWLINAPAIDDIALLKNTSEALSVVAGGINWRSGENIVSSDQEFPSNRIPWQAQARHGVEFREVNLGADSSPEAALMVACDAKTRLLAISSVQYGTGLKLDLQILGEFCRQQGILFCVDAIQSLGVHPVDVQAAQADFMMADAHKWLLGPEGIALFYCRAGVRDQISLHQYGWHMVEDAGNYAAKDWQPAQSARRFECGSPNMLGIHALSASLSLFEETGIEEIYRNIINKISLLYDLTNKIDGINYLSPVDSDSPGGIITFRVGRKNMPELHAKLLEKKVICAYRGGGIRFSPHFYTADDIINKSIDILNITI